jgi:heparan-alpha-glucosaminide N-acetyltransferase
MLNQLPDRLLSIDVFRAVTMFLMIFVNDVSGVSGLPAWLGHASANEDRLGFADTIFPAFLFIVGLSLPFALKKRMDNGASFLTVSAYILTRSAALIIMGFFHVNFEAYSDAAVLPQPVWGLLVTTAFFLIWMDYTPRLKNWKKYSLISLGFILLILMAFLYQGGSAGAPHSMKTFWWGILGIIGWSYLVCASLYLLSRGSFLIMLMTFLFFIGINLITHLKIWDFKIWFLGDAAAESLTMAGVLVSMIYTALNRNGKSAYLWSIIGLCSLIFSISSVLIRPYTGGISKIHGTPAWVLLCIAISLVAFALFIYLIDKKGIKSWFNLIKPAGTSTLTCYLMPYFFLFIYQLAGFYYPSPFNEGWGGVFRSLCFSFIVIVLVGLMERRHIRLKI